MTPKPIVLIVEDEPLLRMTAVDMVEEAGFVAVEAGNADEAVAILEVRPDIRIVFTDIDMPGGMTGAQLAACIRRRWPPIEIIMVSGMSTPTADEMPDRSIFFAKPYQARRVTDAMWRFAA